ncbi:unnamed protein product, partial [Polarella glacialis]
CGHAEVCWLCTVRLRAVLRDFRCPVCKEELPEVALVADAREDAATRSGASVGGALRDAKLGLVYGSMAIRDEVERLFDYSCWQRGCCEAGRCFSTLAALEKHLLDQHKRKFCPTCLNDRK